MKKSIIERTIIAAVLAAITVFSASALEAKVISVKGKVEVQKGSNWVAVKEGDTIQKGAVISTGFKSEAVLKVKESTFTLSPLTRITIEQLAETSTKDDTQMYLDSGNVAFDVKKSENKRVGFKVRSPAATASVRGTSGVCGVSSLRVFTGLVAYGKAEASSAQISDNPPEDTAIEGTSTALTAPSDVGGSSDDVPVFQGQNSRMDTVTGGATSPQSEKLNDARGTPSTTGSLASQEASHDSNAPTPPDVMQGDNGKRYGTVTINIKWDDAE